MSEGSVLGVVLDIHVVLQPDNLWLEEKDEGEVRGGKNQFFLCSVLGHFAYKAWGHSGQRSRRGRVF